MAMHHPSLLESLRFAGFAHADKGLIVIPGCNWNLLILPCLGKGRLLCEIRVWDCSSQTVSPAWGFVGCSVGWGRDLCMARIHPCSSKDRVCP